MPHSQFLGWSEDDQDKALAFRRFEAAVCPGCGTRPDEWASDPVAFVGDQVRCSGCEVLEQERENVPDGAKGVHVRLVTRAYGEQLAAQLDEVKG